MVNAQRTSLRRALSFAGLAALLAAGCQRTLVTLNATPENTGAAPTAFVTDERSAVIQSSAGSVDVRPNADAPWTPAAAGQFLLEDSQLRTGAVSRVLIQLTEGTKIWLGPQTAVTINILNPFLDSLLTSLSLEHGRLWALLNGGALDVETPSGIASARSAYLSAAYDAETGALEVTCLQGTCSFGNIFIPAGFKLQHAESNTAPEAMTLADFGDWGVNVPEATQLAALATEALVQGNATLPVMPTKTAVTAATAGPPSPTKGALPKTPTAAAPPTGAPSQVPAAPPTRAPSRVPAAPIIGVHTVRGGETVFCIARGYGVLPAAIVQANGLSTPFTVVPGQKLKIPAVQWGNILSGPVCAPQFNSPYPGLPVTSPTPPPAPTTTGAATSPPPTTPPLSLSIHFQCLSSCDSGDTYIIRITAVVTGGWTPYTFYPAKVQDLTFPHCVDQSGTVTVTSADGQILTSPWTQHDVSCPTS